MDRVKGSDSPITGDERAEDLCKYAQIYDLADRDSGGAVMCPGVGYRILPL